ncbi:MAG: hypothetical protein QOG87_933 [Actinomycetota bacterium]
MRSLAAVTMAAALLAGCGGHDHDRGPAAPAATFDIDMRDSAFEPEQLTVPAATRVTFVFHNRGVLVHEAFIGDEAEQRAHDAEMVEGASGHHEGHAAVTVEPGKTARLTHIFTADDQLLIGCHQPGHYAAGMRIAINVKD